GGARTDRAGGAGRHVRIEAHAADAVAEELAEPEVAVGTGGDVERRAGDSLGEARDRARRGDAADVAPRAAVVAGEPDVLVGPNRDADGTGAGGVAHAELGHDAGRRDPADRV